MKTHHYELTVVWTGNMGKGTESYKAYKRDHSILINGKYSEIRASSDASFLGDPTRYNPEELFLSSISGCHMLWYLHLCTVNKIIVTEYMDHATGLMEETEDGSGRFTAVKLYPQVKITDAALLEKANQLHTEANKMCFIANSCNFRIEHHPSTLVH